MILIISFSSKGLQVYLRDSESKAMKPDIPPKEDKYNLKKSVQNGHVYRDLPECSALLIHITLIPYASVTSRHCRWNFFHIIISIVIDGCTAIWQCPENPEPNLGMWRKTLKRYPWSIKISTIPTPQAQLSKFFSYSGCHQFCSLLYHSLCTFFKYPYHDIKGNKTLIDRVGHFFLSPLVLRPRIY